MKGLSDAAEYGGIILLLAAVVVAICWVTSWVLMFAWNAVFPDLLGLRTITHWQAFALQCVLSGIGSALRGAR